MAAEQTPVAQTARDPLAVVRELARIGALDPLDRHFAELLWRLEPSAPSSVLLAGALVCHAVTEGHVCLQLDACSHIPLLDSEARAVQTLSWPSLDSWLAELEASPLVSDGSRNTPLVLSGSGRVYLLRYFALERELAAGISRRLQTRSWDSTVLQQGLKRLFGDEASRDEASRDDFQRLAALAAATQNFTLICGGPGTGKTTTVAKILVLIAAQSCQAQPPTAVAADERNQTQPVVRVLLLAPTGKAAQRLFESCQTSLRQLQAAGETTETIELHASTIHRSLEYRARTPTNFGRNAQNPLWANVIVIDEASMIDVALMARLLTAISLDAQVLLLGDKDQLASVQAGSIFGDICTPGLERGHSAAFRARVRGVLSSVANTTLAGAHALSAHDTGQERPSPNQATPVALEDCIVQLVKSYRYDSRGGIGQLARFINQGQADQATALLGRCPEHVHFHELEPSAPNYPERLARLLGPHARRAYADYLDARDPAAKLQQLQRFRTLVVHRAGRVGVAAVNRIIESSLESRGLVPHASPYSQQPVLIYKNDHQLGIYNGDVGVVLLNEAGHFQTWVTTAAGLSVFPTSRLPHFETAFAMTVHKSQGSEFDEVFIILPAADSPLLTRELLYTAVTRAKHTVHLVGSVAALRSAIDRRVQRVSGLRELLWPETPGDPLAR